MNCGYQGERISRHNRLRDQLHRTAVEAGVGPTKEEAALIPWTELRPADVFIPAWTNGKDTALDITVINPLQEATIV